MAFVIFQTVVQSIASTLHWLGFYFGARRLRGSGGRRWAWIFGSAVLAIAWLLGALLMASSHYFDDDVLPLGVPIALGLSLAFGYMLLLSRDFRTIIAAVPSIGSLASRPSEFSGACFSSGGGRATCLRYSPFQPESAICWRAFSLRSSPTGGTQEKATRVPPQSPGTCSE